MKLRQAALVGAILVLTTIPYLAGYLYQDAGRRFTGIVFDVPDTAQYFAWMRAFSHGTLIQNPLTPDAGLERFFNAQWWLMGVLAFDTGIGPLAAYHGLRVAALALFAYAVARLARQCAPNDARLAFTIVMLASGLGWVWIVRKQFTGSLDHPLDVQVAEANTFFSAMAFPHLLFAAGITVLVFSLYLRDIRQGDWRLHAALFGLMLLLGFSHGYDLIPTLAMPLATSALLAARERDIRPHLLPCAALIGGAMPPAAYLLSLTQLDPTWRGVLSQYDNAGVFTPSPPHLLILLGAPFLLAVWQLRPSAWRGADATHLFPRVWLIVGFALLYIPTDYQIKMLTGYQVPIAFLAAQTTGELLRSSSARRLPARWLCVAPAALVGFLFLTNAYLTAWRVVDLRRGAYPYYLSSGDVAALERLEQVAEPGDVVLSSPTIGLFVPVYSDARPYVAHWAQTLAFFERREAATWYFAGQRTRAERDAFVLAQNIGFVISGPAEAALNDLPARVEIALPVVVDSGTLLVQAAPRGRGD